MKIESGSHYEGTLKYLGWNTPWITLIEHDDYNTILNLKEIVFSTLESLTGKLVAFEVRNELFKLCLSEKSIANAWQLIETKGKIIFLENTSSPIIINLGQQLERVLIWLTGRKVAIDTFQIRNSRHNQPELIGFNLKSKPSILNLNFKVSKKDGVIPLTLDAVQDLCQREKCIFLKKEEDNGLTKFFCQKFTPEAVKILEQFQNNEEIYSFSELFPKLGRFCCCPDHAS